MIGAGGGEIGLPPPALLGPLIECYEGHCDPHSGVEYQHTSFVGPKSAPLSDVCTIGIVAQSVGLCSVVFTPGRCTDSAEVSLRA